MLFWFEEMLDKIISTTLLSVFNPNLNKSLYKLNSSWSEMEKFKDLPWKRWNKDEIEIIKYG